MATILTARSWDCGQLQINEADIYSPSITAWAVVSNTRAKTGTYSLKLDGSFGPNTVRFAIGAGDDHPSCSVWIHPDTVLTYNVDSAIRLRYGLSSSVYVDLRWNGTTHTFDAYVNDALVEAGTVEVSNIDWFHVQFYCVIDNAGSINVRIDGHESISYSGDTLIGADPAAYYLYFYVNGASSQYAYFDDLVVGIDGYLGDLRCIDIRPTADTAQDDWTPSAGRRNYSTIDEVSTNAATIDADYNYTNTTAQADELALGDFDGTTYTPKATVAWVRARMLEASGDSIKVGVDSGGTDSTTTHALSASMEYYFHTDDDNPADSAEWEDADIDALLLRYESVIT